VLAEQPFSCVDQPLAELPDRFFAQHPWQLPRLRTI
jgi:hypothetical protein